jgi:heat shock protein HslJ
VAISSLAGIMSLAVGACGGDDDDTSAEAGTRDTGSPVTSGELESHTWQLTSYATDAADDLTAAQESNPATAQFENGRVSGSTGCNRFNASYQLSTDGAITIGEAATTRMACSEDLAAQETQFLAALADSRRAVTADDALQMLNASGDVVLVFRSAPGPSTTTRD